MKFIHRLAYYLFGFSIGLIFLFFFLSKKEASCDYSPNARVKKNIRIKPKVYSEAVLERIKENNLDTSYVSHLLVRGKVDFSRSNTNLDICNIYVITGKLDDKQLKLEVENCPDKAVILSLSEDN
jgi:mRNA-degrading endonuclease YafQ of YafQ-DinJ toxin-antitoxin module